jgi:hypothetical protein
MIYPPESFSILGEEPFVEEVAGQGKPRRTERRTYTGRKLSLPQWAEILCGAADNMIRLLSDNT